MKRRLLSIVLLCIGKSIFCQVSAIHTVFLIGDTGKDTLASPAIQLLKSEIEKTPNSTVVFLGDNVYPNGLSIDANHPEVVTIPQKKMVSQLEIFKEYKGNVFMVPGNHDWNKCKWNGKQWIKDEAVFMENYLKKNTSIANKNEEAFFPKEAGPGPVSIQLKESLRLVIIDTQWWLQQQFFHPVGTDKGKNKRSTKERFYRQLDSLLTVADKNNERVLLAAHHPLFSNGRHSNARQPWRFLINYTPLQVLGLLGLNRFFMQDIPQPRYKKMKRELMEVIDKHKNIIYVSGHDHNLQFSKHGNLYHIISGAGSFHSKVKEKEDLLFYKSQSGLFKLSYFANGQILVEAMDSYNKEVFFSYWVK